MRCSTFVGRIASFAFFGALASTLAACDEESVDAAPESAQASDVEKPVKAAEAADPAVLERIVINEHVTREVTKTSLEPAAEITTKDGNYVAFFVDERGIPGYFEAIPEGGTSLLMKHDSNDPRSFFAVVAPEERVPAALERALTFDAAAELFDRSPEALAAGPVAGTARIGGLKQKTEPAAITGLGCTKAQANDFFDNYRPGVGSDESTDVWPSWGFNYQVPQATRAKSYSKFYQTNFDQITEQPPNAGGIPAQYYRVSALMCEGAGRMTAFTCWNTQDTFDHGCGNAGSTIQTTYGPVTLGAGTAAVLKFAGNADFTAGRLDQMSSGTDHAYFTEFGSVSSSESAISSCFN